MLRFPSSKHTHLSHGFQLTHQRGTKPPASIDNPGWLDFRAASDVFRRAWSLLRCELLAIIAVITS
jgi:hypothetical protein